MNSDQEIAKLRRVSDQHKQAIKTEFEELVGRSKKLAIRILIIGGGLALAYTIARIFLDPDDEKGSRDETGKKKVSAFAEVRNFVMAELAAFLLSLAKEKLTEYLNEVKTETHVHTESTE